MHLKVAGTRPCMPPIRIDIPGVGREVTMQPGNGHHSGGAQARSRERSKSREMRYEATCKIGAKLVAC